MVSKKKIALWRKKIQFSHDLEGTKKKVAGRLERVMFLKNSKRAVNRNASTSKNEEERSGCEQERERRRGRNLTEIFIRKKGDMMKCMR